MILAALLGAAAAAAPASAPPTDRFPDAAASYVVAIDGRVVWERKGAVPRLPASLTKIMTALVLVEEGWDTAASVTVSQRAAAATGSRAGLKAGEVLTAGDLLTAMLVTSANDACLALAEHAGEGRAAPFVARMNARAKAMGLPATRFANACGHDDPGQRSSARDLLAISEAAMAHPEISKVAAMREATIATARGRRIEVKTGNHLLGRSEGVYGIKSGYTGGAGKCLAAAAERDGRRVVIVLLDSPDRWWQAAGMIELAFDHGGRKIVESE